MITKEYLQQELAKRIDGYKRGVETTTDNIIAEMKSILVLVNALPDYEKKYNEALERAKKFAIDDAYASQGVIAKLIFPELSKREDERIRKWLIDYFSSIKATVWIYRDITCEQIIDWLEKQKEHHIPWYDYQKSKEAGYTIVPNEEYEQLIKQKEQKPNYCHHEVDETGWTEEYRKAYYDGWNNCNMQHEQLKANQKPAEWSEVELEFRGEKVTVKRPFFRDDKGRGYSTAELDEDVAWNALRAWCEKKGISLYDLYPKAEWSEEDKNYYDTIVRKLEVIGDDSGLSDNQIKFLREHCPLFRSEWNEEDETIIEGACSALEIHGHTKLASKLKSLRPSWKPSEQDQLMKLKYAGTRTKLD